MSNVQAAGSGKTIAPGPEINAAEENAEILRRYRGLLRAVRGERSIEDTRMIRKAFNIAVEA
ncbi:MAG TPA: hypothetical protein VKG92_10750, partial [Flavobacteriales bacterium]|nr:hypothetical protein [Flavobacteriales bacterium]